MSEIKMCVIRFPGERPFYAKFWTDDGGIRQWEPSDKFVPGCLIPKAMAKAWCKNADPRYEILPVDIVIGSTPVKKA